MLDEFYFTTMTPTLFKLLLENSETRLVLGPYVTPEAPHLFLGDAITHTEYNHHFTPSSASFCPLYH